jgi:hypothetical protein
VFIDVPTDNGSIAETNWAEMPHALWRRGVHTEGALRGPGASHFTRESNILRFHPGLDEALPGDVLVINGLEDVSRAAFGDLFADVCVARGVVGVLIDGAVRDVDSIGEVGVLVWRER